MGPHRWTKINSTEMHHGSFLISFLKLTMLSTALMGGGAALDCYECMVYEQELSTGGGTRCLSPVTANMKAQGCNATAPSCYKYVYHSTQTRRDPNSTELPQVLKGFWMRRGCLSTTTDPVFTPPNLSPTECKAFPRILLDGSSPYSDPKAESDVHNHRYICVCSKDKCNEEEGFNISRQGSANNSQSYCHSQPSYTILYAGVLTLFLILTAGRINWENEQEGG